MLGSLIVLALIFLLAGNVFAERGPLFFLRAVGMGLAVMIPFWFNFNWLTSKSVHPIWLAGLFLLLFAFSFLRNKKFIFDINENRQAFLQAKKQWGWFFVMVVVLAGLAFVRFEGKMDVPNYETPDAAIHFLYLSQTAKTGIMPQFLPSVIYPASGFSEVFKVHHLSYFPGATVAFSLLAWISGMINLLPILQIFNGIFYALCVLYLFWLAYDSNVVFSKIGCSILFLLLTLGSLFDFVVTSHTTQLFGLFMMIFFIDVFVLWKKDEIGLWLPILALSGLMLSYFYWLPIVLLFFGLLIFNELIAKRQERDFKKTVTLLFKIFVIGLGAILLTIGYIKITLAIGVLGAATSDGGFSYKQNFLADTILMLPFALGGLWLFWKKNRKKENLLLFLTIATFAYSVLLYVAWRWLGKASNYVRMKVLFLTLPLVWIWVVYFFEQLIAHVWQNKTVTWKKTLFDFLHARKFFVGALIVLEIFLWKVTNEQPLAVAMGNVQLLIKGSAGTNSEKNSLNREQVKLLDELKKNHPEALKDGRIMTIAPPGVGFWVFAYAGIWPMTDVLSTGGAAGDAMNPWGGLDYQQWLMKDKNHYILYLDSEPSRGWVDTYGFNKMDYEVLARQGKNLLLQLPVGKNTTYVSAIETVTKEQKKKGQKNKKIYETYYNE